MDTPTPAVDPLLRMSTDLTAALRATTEVEHLTKLGWSVTCQVRSMRQTSHGEGDDRQFVTPVLLTLQRKSILISTIVETPITSVSAAARARELLVPTMALGTGAVAISGTLDA